MTTQHGPDSEQLDLPEDMDRLADLGDLILAGHVRIEDCGLLKFERAFVEGYVSRGGAAADADL